MSTYNYAPGAVHLDFHHNNIAMSASQITDLVRSFLPVDIEPVQEEPSFTPQRGQRRRSFFIDDETTDREKKRFLDYLHMHNLGTNDFDSSEENSGNQIAVCFYRQWQKQDLLHPKAGGTAFVRFLRDDCDLSISVEEKALGNVLSRMINSSQRYSNWCGDISAYCQN